YARRHPFPRVARPPALPAICYANISAAILSPAIPRQNECQMDPRRPCFGNDDATMNDRIPEILKRVAAVWQVDDNRVQWSTPSAEDSPGFDWWPGDFRVRVRADWQLEAEAGSAVRVIVRTDFLKDVAIDSDRFERMTTMMAGYPTSTYAWIYPPR